MIDWEKVRLGLVHDKVMNLDRRESLKAALKRLYIKDKLSLRQICTLIPGELTERPLSERLKSYGFKLRGRGGANYTKDFTLTFKEYNSLTLRQLRDLKGVSTHCIINKAKKLGFFNKKERRRNVKSK